VTGCWSFLHSRPDRNSVVLKLAHLDCSRLPLPGGMRLRRRPRPPARGPASNARRCASTCSLQPHGRTDRLPLSRVYGAGQGRRGRRDASDCDGTGTGGLQSGVSVSRIAGGNPRERPRGGPRDAVGLVARLRDHGGCVAAPWVPSDPSWVGCASNRPLAPLRFERRVLPNAHREGRPLRPTAAQAERRPSVRGLVERTRR
jgi:hypothetical protein